MNAWMQRMGVSFLPILGLLFLWEVIARMGYINPLLFPPPSIVIQALWGLLRSGVLLWDAAISLWRVLVGLGIGILLGVITGLLTGRMNAFDIVLSPIIHALRPLPPVAIIPLVIVWFGIDDAAKIFSIALATFFPVWLNAHNGARHIAKEYFWSAELLTSSPSIIFFYVVLPGAMPMVVTGIRSAISTSFIMVFVSELAGAHSGLGYRISITQLSYRVDQMIAALVILSLLSALCDALFTKGIAFLFPWLTPKQ